MSLFRTGKPQTELAATPALMFRDLKRHPDVKYLWGHQQQILDVFHTKHIDTPDLALELPTGAGKTLVGLLIAQHRMLSKKMRAAFLCPTKQLAIQVSRAAARYGISSVLLIGPQKQWATADFTKYQRAEAVAITTYSAIFNVSPKLDDADLLICDDAHAADTFIGKLWSVTITHKEHALSYSLLQRSLAPLLPESMLRRIESDDRGSGDADLISHIALEHSNIALKDLLDGAMPEDQKYSYSMIVDKLHACNLYASAAAFEICPITPPTRSHAPFAGAKQRIYMSATLGDDGSIERSFGVKKIVRLPIPEGWDRRGSGRRLMLFPDLSTDASTSMNIIKSLAANESRTLILAPSSKISKRVTAEFAQTHTVLSATDVEQDLSVFTKHAGPVALIVANRFDGIDLPGDDCRLLIVMGLPDVAGLQETYMVYRLGASALLRDRVRTRITQALGRCTRDEGDYAAVVIVGADILKWFSTKPNVEAMHPELQAEIEFGITNSTDRTSDDYAQLVQALMEHGAEWDAAETEIARLRAAATKRPDSEAAALAAAAAFEIEYVYALWDNRLEDAISHAKGALDALSGGSVLKPYRSFWHHQLAVAAFLSWRLLGADNYRIMCVDQLSRATATATGLRWLGKLQTALSGVAAAVPAEVIPTQEWYSQISNLLADWGLAGANFSRQLMETERRLRDVNNTKSVEMGIENLGRMLGFRSKRFKESGGPDGAWWLDDWHAFTFESKLDAKTKTASFADLRQAGAHPKYLAHLGIIAEGGKCTVIFVSNHSQIASEARAHTAGVFHLTHSELMSLYSAAAEALSRLRSLVVNMTDEAAYETAWSLYAERSLTPAHILLMLCSKPVETLPDEVVAAGT